jgi:hypothetical protein
MAIWIVSHVVAMFIAFGLTTGVGIYFSAIAGTLDVKSIRTAVKIARPLQVGGLTVLLVGVVLGFATAGSAGYVLTSRWLIETYVLVALLLIVGAGVHQTWLARVAKAAAASTDEHASPELAAIVRSRLVRIAGPVSGLIWIALIAVMILRPS